MKKSRLPKTDSIQRLAEFWDAHDVTDFEDQLEEETEPAFRRTPRSGSGSAQESWKKTRAGGGSKAAINVPLKVGEFNAVERLAIAKGVSSQQLVRGWVLKKIAGRSNGRKVKR